MDVTGKQIVLRLSLALAAAVLALAALLGAWWQLFANRPSDPRGPRYVFWKWGLRDFEPSLFGPFIRDPGREEMIRNLLNWQEDRLRTEAKLCELPAANPQRPKIARISSLASRTTATGRPIPAGTTAGPENYMMVDSVSPEERNVWRQAISPSPPL